MRSIEEMNAQTSRMRAIARLVAVDVLEDFAKELKSQLAAGALVTPEFIDDAVANVSREPRISS